MPDKVPPDSTPLDPVQLALKEVYTRHKERLIEVKTQYDSDWEIRLNRLQDRVNHLQEQNEVLCSENTVLNKLLTNVRSQDGRTSCGTCDHLQRSLSVIREAYEQSLEEKDKMIGYLSDRLAEASHQSSSFGKQPPANLSNILTPDKSVCDGDESRPRSSKGRRLSQSGGDGVGLLDMLLDVGRGGGQSKDSARVTGAPWMSGTDVDGRAGHVSDETGDQESPETVRQKTLRLGRNNTKRSRYTEDNVHESKRQKCDESRVRNTTDESNIPQKTPPKPVCHPKTRNSRVLVPETCDVDLDLATSMTSDDGGPDRLQNARRSLIGDTDVVDYTVVPETLGMGLDGSERWSSSDSDTDTQDTIKAKVTSPGHVLQSSSESDDEIQRVSSIVDSKTHPGNKIQREPASEFDRRVVDVPAEIDLLKGRGSSNDGPKDKDCKKKASSPVFIRRSIESPFLFEEDGPARRSVSRSGGDLSGLASDYESPLIVEQVAAVYDVDLGQSPALSQTRRNAQVGRGVAEKTHSTNSVMLTSRGERQSVKKKNTSAIWLKESTDNRRQTTMTQAFTSSQHKLPVVNLSASTSEDRTDVEKDESKCVRTKKPLFSRRKKSAVDAEMLEHAVPVFKRPSSPSILRSPKAKSLKNRRSPPKIYSLKEKSVSKITAGEKIVIDLDETVAPETACFESYPRPSPLEIKNLHDKPRTRLTMTAHNSSLGPDTESLSQGKVQRKPNGSLALKSNSLVQNVSSASMDTEDGLGIERKSGKSDSSNQNVIDSGSRKQDKSSKSKKSNNMGMSESNVIISGSQRLNHGGRDIEYYNEGTSLGPRSGRPSSSVVLSDDVLASQGHSQDEEDNEADVTLNPKFVRSHMFQAQIDESQSIPLSSLSYKFGPSKSSKSNDSCDQRLDVEVVEVEDDDTPTPCGHDKRKSLDNSFDRVPRKQAAEYAHVEVVRKKVERQQLKATTCQDCYEFYKSKGLSEEDIHKQIQHCSRHRARYLPPSTPEHFWSIGFPDTQECEERGYIGKASPSKQKPGCRRRRRLMKRFKTRQEEEEEEEEEEESQTETQT